MSDGRNGNIDKSGIPVGMMRNPDHGFPTRENQQASLSKPEFIHDPDYYTPANRSDPLPDWAEKTGHEVVPTFASKRIGGPGREGYSVETGDPTGYMYDNGKSQYVYTDLKGNVLRTDDRSSTGWNAFRDDMLTPAAIAAAIYFTGGAAAEGLGAGAAGTGAAAAGTGATLAGDAMMPGMLASGTYGAGTASGLAGMAGMNAGYAASALNAGAFGTGMGLARGQNIGDALQGGLRSAALSPVGGMASDAVGGGALGTLASNTAIGAAGAGLNGGDILKGAQTGLENGVVNAAGNYIGDMAKDSTSDLGKDASNTLGNAAGALTRTAIRGGNLSKAAGNLATNALTDFATGAASNATGISKNDLNTAIQFAKNPGSKITSEMLNFIKNQGKGAIDPVALAKLQYGGGQQQDDQTVKVATGGTIVGVGGLKHGGEPAKYHPAAPEGHYPEFITGQTGNFVQGKGDGQSDEVPAMLAKGEYVFDSDVVSALGNGDNAAGASVLDKMREEIRKHKRSAPVNKIPPKAKSTLAYLQMASKG